MEYIYSWIPAYKQIVAKLPEYKNRQLELIQVLRDIGVNVTEDEDRPGHKVPLIEIDPFSFIFYLGSPKNYWNKIKVLRNLCEKWNINVVVNDVSGIPTANAQRLRMFPWKHTRKNEIFRLWVIFDLLLKDGITNEVFAEFEQLPGAAKTKITEAFFIVRPDKYLCINGKVKPYLLSKGINTEFKTFNELQALLNKIITTLSTPFHVISFESHIYSEYGAHVPNYYRIGTTAGSGGKSLLPEMIHNSIVSIGWRELGNLQEKEVLNRKHLITDLQDNGYYVGDNRTASNQAGQILRFYNELNPGDFVFAAEGAKIKAIGVIISDHYVFDENLEFPNCRCVKWLKTDITDLNLNEGLRTSVWQYVDPEILNQIANYFSGNNISNSIQQNSIKNNMALNTILFGPPGTGKTFHSISLAVAIIENVEPEKIEEESNHNREAVKSRYEKYVTDGQIVFTTFHQSMGYEDFIEGIKPIPPDTEDDQLYYDTKDGIFKKLCTEAAFSFVNPKTSPETEKALDFSSAYDLWIDEINEKLSKGEKPFILTRNRGKIFIESISSKSNINVFHKDGKRIHIVSKRRLAKLHQAFPDLNEVTNISSQFNAVIGGSNATAYYAVLNEIKKQIDKPKLEVLIEFIDKEYDYADKKEIISSLKDQDFKGVSSKNFVLIIDEINRGNVSQIFGELISLIEDDKRLGKKETLSITLPYSQEKFGVPPNVHIIGTMNTADRSVEALDTALRRRFSFIPTLPQENILTTTDDGINLSKVLQTINNRLRVLKDNDHTIGHAWFWNVTNVEQLRKIFANKILPLLQEYFYNDYEKLGLVLGDPFFKVQTQINSNVFAHFTGGNGLAGQYERSWLYELKSPTELIIDDFKSLETERTLITQDEE